MKGEARSIKNVHLVSHLIEERPKNGPNATFIDDYPISIHSMYETKHHQDSESFIYNDMNSMRSTMVRNPPSALLINQKHTHPHTDLDFLEATSLNTIISSGRPLEAENIPSPLLLRNPTMEINPPPREYHQRCKSNVSKVRLIKEKLNQQNVNYHSLEEPSYDLLDENVLYDLDKFAFKQDQQVKDKSNLLLPCNHQLFIPANSPHDYKSHYNGKRPNLIWRAVSLTFPILFFGLLFGLFVNIIICKGFDSQLTNFKVNSLTNVLINEAILMVDIETSAFNFNYQDIYIWDLDLDIFLITDGLSDSTSINNNQESNNSMVTILLGNSQKFLTPLTFPNSNDSKPINSTAQLRLYKPGQTFKLNNSYLTHDQWLKIFNSKFNLIIRGNLKYQLPFSWEISLININAETTVNT